jgi:hypothetical protein
MSLITFRRLEGVSFFHSAVYLALLVCAFVLGKPQPETFILGLAHGLLWIGMSLVCIAAARWRVIPYWLAVTVAVLGGLGPFAGSVGFLVADRRQRASHHVAPASQASQAGNPRTRVRVRNRHGS